MEGIIYQYDNIKTINLNEHELIVKIDEKLDLYNAVDLLKNNNKINLVVLIHRESEQQKELSRSRKNQEIEEWRDK